MVGLSGGEVTGSGGSQIGGLTSGGEGLQLTDFHYPYVACKALPRETA